MIPSTLRKTLPGCVRGALKRIYSLVPVERRMGAEYWKLRAFLREAQWWNRQRIEAWQLEKLKEIVRHAYENVPGYEALFNDAGVKPGDVQSLADIRILPFTTKQLLRDNLKEFTACNIPKWQLNYLTTGGSTGIPLGLYKTGRDSIIEDVFMHTSWERAGWRLGPVAAVLRGEYTGSEDKIWRYDRLHRLLNLSSYYLSERNYQSYAAKIEEFRPRYLQAYPSVATMLADLIIQNGMRGRIDLDVILLGSENIYDWQKEKLRSAFPGARLFGWYGHTERAILAAWCEHSEKYHDWPFYGVTEILGEDDGPAAIGGVGELVGTCLWSLATPFIRYRTMDLAVRGAAGCDKCRRQFNIIESVEGRKQDYVVTSDGDYVTLTALIFAQHFHAFGVIRNMQLYQDRVGEVTVKVAPTAAFTERDSAEIKNKMEAAVGGRLRVKIVLVDKILPAQSGKWRFLEQKLPVKYGD